MANTMTYFNALSIVLAFAKENGFNDAEVIERAQRAIDTHKTKTNGQKVETKTQKINKNLAAQLAEKMVGKGMVTARVVADTFGLAGVTTTNKVSVLMRILVNEGLVEKTTIKGVVNYILVSEKETEVVADDAVESDAAEDVVDDDEDGLDW